jgi:sugar/nucleoside kinase (ribokinase family)
MAEVAATRSGVLCVGSVIVDLAKVIDHYPDQERLALIRDVSVSTGGPALNLAVDLRRLGAPFPLELVGVVGDDEHGRLVLDACAALGIGTSALRAVPDAATSFTDAMVVRDGGTRTFFHHPGANALLAAKDVDVTGSRAKILHAGAPGLHPRMDAPDQGGGNHWASLLQAAQSVGMRTTMELVSLPDEQIRAVALPCLPHLDYLVINEIEAAALTGAQIRSADVDGHPNWSEFESVAIRLVELGVSRLVAVHFPAGCVAAAPGGLVWRQGSVRLPRSAVRNATGAGDAFAAGVIYGLHEELPVKQCLRLGVCVAAASLEGAATSDGVLPVAQCLALGDRHGFRSTAGPIQGDA